MAARVGSPITRFPRVRSPYSAVFEIEWRIPVMPFSYIRSTISFSSCRHSKYASRGSYPASTRVS
jgi:hypothetical protein